MNLLKALGRRDFETRFIDRTDEDFFLTHILHHNKTRTASRHVFEKVVHIYVLSSILGSWAQLIPYSSVQYQHRLVANGDAQQHENDAKGFGQCSSTSEYDEVHEIFTIHWKLNGLRLDVSHTVTRADQLKAVLRVTPDGQERHTTEATKLYVRQPFTAAQEQKLEQRRAHPNMEVL